MGLVCARCEDVKKSKGETVPVRPELDESEGSAEEEDSDRSEVVAASDDDEDNQEEYKQGVEEILKTTGSTLKRGKTVAMKEAISTAKKYNIEASTVAEAEKRLDTHKRQQRREEVEGEIQAFYESSSARDRDICEKLLKKAKDADCSEAVVDKLSDWLEEIIVNRDLEPQETEQAREYLRQSCRDFVIQATQGGGRPAMLVDLEDGKRTPVLLSLDAPLQSLSLQDEDAAQWDSKTVDVASLKAVNARDDKRVKLSTGFSYLEDEDMDCALALRYELNRVPGVWCFVETTPLRRDRLIEALSVLASICG